MERLQVAIAKARAARDGAAADPDAVAAEAPRTRPPRRAPDVAAPPAAEGAGAEAWDAIPRFTPDAKLLERGRIVTATGGRQSTEFDKLRTRIAQQMQANGWTRMAITSPGPGCGKSTIALNLSYSLTRQDAARIVLCEMDLRRPSLGRLTGAPTDRDFTEVLRGRASFASQSVRLGDNFAAGFVRGAKGGTAELLQARSTAEALDRLQAEYQPTTMVFDTPPLLVSDDTIGLVAHVDCAMIVAGAGTTTIAEIDTCERELAAQVPVLGVVLNKCKHTGPQTSDYYYY
ncbi:CpsD/CapB family tyrosine-protein kinase [Jannaschia sp. LMIT008]|uniref:CpsD/CapB family tyrosine-protein kinase n=1 Tax=Jannaschia maritima TaxID=3032585 RepID=UPI002811EEB2|nr:CpsD/CapB family tyrosine-protein kinase [Jannaschia sp. LMIT008]